MFLCYLVVLDIQYFKLCDITEKRKIWEDIYLEPVALFVYQYSYTFFTSKQIDLSKKNKELQKLYDMNVGAICEYRQAGRH